MKTVIGIFCFCLFAIANVSCRGPESSPAPSALLSSDAVEILVEADRFAPPVSDDPTRFFAGWRPDGDGGLRLEPSGGILQFVTTQPGPRRLVLDLKEDEGIQAGGHLSVRFDSGPVSVVPLLDPLTLHLPADFSIGLHHVELRPKAPDAPLPVVTGTAIRPAPVVGSATVVGERLIQTGPSLVDLLAKPAAGMVLVGKLCSSSWLASVGDMSVRLSTHSDPIGTGWENDDRFTDRLRRCRTIRLPGPIESEPVRVRFAAGQGSAGEWRELSWQPSDGKSTTAAAELGTKPQESQERPRRVILYVLDALRADGIGPRAAGEGSAPTRTPTLDKLAREGHTFLQHHSPAPNTLLSIRQLFVGQPLVNQAAWDNRAQDYPTLAERFQEAGYRTGLFSGNGYVSERFGLGRGFDYISNEALYRPPTSDEEVNRNAERVHRAALAWLETIEEDEPAFLYLHTIHPHNPYAPPKDLATQFTRGIPSNIDGSTRTLTALARGRRSTVQADRQRLRRLYAASVAYNDQQLARFLAAIGARSSQDSTMLFLTSDHGEELYDHGGWLHGYTLYQEQLHVPLIAWSPGRIAEGGVTSSVTDAFDLHRTLSDLASRSALTTSTQAEATTGHDLWPALSSGREEKSAEIEPRFFSADAIAGGVFALRFGRWKYIWARGTPERWVMGLGGGRSWDREYFFDLEDDPGERENLAGSGTVTEQWMRAVLRRWVGARLAEAHGAEHSDEPKLSKEEADRLKALGYLD